MTTNVESIYENTTNLRPQQWIEFKGQTYNPVRVFNKPKVAQVHSTTHINIADETIAQILEVDKEFEKEKMAFFSMTETDKKKYMGKYVAIYKGKVEDFDTDESKLIGRFFNQYRSARVYIDKVGDEDEILEIYSPYSVE